MTKEQFIKIIKATIDKESEEMDPLDYAEALEELNDDINIMAEAARDDLRQD